MKSNKILAIETSSRVFSLALAESGASPTKVGGYQWGATVGGYGGGLPQRGGVAKVRGELFLDIGLKHSEVLKEACGSLLSCCNWKKEDLTAIAVCTGPGSFTGLRVGISFARSICQILNLPLLGIPVFEVMNAGLNKIFNEPEKDQSVHPVRSLAHAFGVSPVGTSGEATSNGVHCVLIDSVKGELFAGFFTFGKMQSLEPYRIYSLQQLFKKLGAFSKIWISGDGFLHYQKEFENKLGKRLLGVPEEFHFPRARHLSVLALEKLKASRRRRFLWEKVVPFYLRPPLAEERRIKLNH